MHSTIVTAIQEPHGKRVNTKNPSSAACNFTEASSWADLALAELGDFPRLSGRKEELRD